MQLSDRGVFLFTEGLSAKELADSAERAERLGYGAIWYPEAAGREPFVTATRRSVAATPWCAPWASRP